MFEDSVFSCFFSIEEIETIVSLSIHSFMRSFIHLSSALLSVHPYLHASSQTTELM